jgi:hypothetical protein
LIHQLPPVAHPFLRTLEKGALGFPLQERDELAQRAARVADESDVDGITQADAHRIGVDLHRPRLPRLRHELDVRERRAGDQQRVAMLHRVAGRPRAEQTDAAGRQRMIVLEHALAEEGFDDRRAEEIGDLFDFFGGAERSASDEHRDALAGVEQVGRALQIVIRGQSASARENIRRVAGKIARRSLAAFLFLQVGREVDVRRRAIRERDPARQRGHVLDMRRAHHPHAVARDVLEQFVEIDVLLRERPDEVVVVMPGDRQHRLSIELRVVQAVQEMDPTRPRRRDADAEPAGVFRVTARHERRRFLVPDLNETDLVLPLPQRLHDPVDPIPGKPENDLDTPVDERVDEDLRRAVRHAVRW